MQKHRVVGFVLVACMISVASFAGTDEPATEGEFVPPQIILSTQKQPVYPPAAFEARYEGSVMLEMTVTPEGEVGDVKVLKCTRPKVGFEDAATRAIKQWRFEPGTEDGEPIEVTTRFRLNFTRVGVGTKARPQVSAGSFTALEDVTDQDDRVVAVERRTIASPPPSRDRR